MAATEMSLSVSRTFDRFPARIPAPRWKADLVAGLLGLVATAASANAARRRRFRRALGRIPPGGPHCAITVRLRILGWIVAVRPTGTGSAGQDVKTPVESLRPRQVDDGGYHTCDSMRPVRRTAGAATLRESSAATPSR